MTSLPDLLGALNQAASARQILCRPIDFHTDIPENSKIATQDMLRSLDNTILCIIVGIELLLERYCTLSGELDLMMSVGRFADARDALTKFPKPDLLDTRIDQALLKMVKLMEKRWRTEAMEATKRAHAQVLV